jgi:hypothetical protein
LGGGLTSSILAGFLKILPSFVITTKSLMGDDALPRQDRCGWIGWRAYSRGGASAKNLWPEYRAVTLYASSCVYRLLDSAILTVKAAEDRLRCNGAKVLNDAMERRVLGQ